MQAQYIAIIRIALAYILVQQEKPKSGFFGKKIYGRKYFFLRVFLLKKIASLDLSGDCFNRLLTPWATTY